MSKYTLTIGVPAFNEEANIGVIISDVLKQKTLGFVIKKIIVASDNSTDKTESIVKKFKNKKIVLLTSKKREGQAKRQNQIIKNTTSDILVLINADTRILQKNYLEKLIKPIMKNEADLTSSNPVPLPPKSFFEKILMSSINIKSEIFENYKDGNNIYTCHGRARAFSKKLYKKLVFKNSIGEDAYSYLFAITNSFTYRNVSEAKIHYKLPQSLSDHENQSVRFIKTKKLLYKEFGKETVESEYSIPKILVIKSLFLTFIKSPFLTGLYVLTFGYMKIKSKTTKNIKNTWTVSQSSKLLTN